MNGKPTAYIETTIPSYLVARPSSNLRLAADQADTIAWWDDHRHKYDLFISVVVLREIGRGEPMMAVRRLESIQGIPLLDPSPVAESVATRLLERVLPSNAAEDASHIAIAAAHSIDFLVTWNCKHINNPLAIRRMEQCCRDFDLRCPVVASPTELLSIEL